jgi:membrane-associated phospholipid phosphatase
VWAVVPRPARRVVYLLLAGFLVLGALVVLAEGLLLRADEPLYFDLLESSGDVDRWTPDWVNYLGRWEVATPIALLLALAFLRHPILAVAYPAVVVIGGLTNLLVSWLTHRLRPPDGGHAGEFTSFPGGHSIQLTLLLGAIPLAAFMITRRTWVAGVAGVAAILVWAAAWADALRTGGHWPSDHLAGLFIGVALLVVVYGVAANRSVGARWFSRGPRATKSNRTTP